MIGLTTVYETDPRTGELNSPKTLPSEILQAVPKCPACNRQVQQHVTQRYNRLIDYAVIDEMSKRFISMGQASIADLEIKMAAIDASLTSTFPEVIALVKRGDTTRAETLTEEINTALRDRYRVVGVLQNSITNIKLRTAESQQPARKLGQAIVNAMQRSRPIKEGLAMLGLGDCRTVRGGDRRVALGVEALGMKLRCLLLEDKLRIFSAIKDKVASTKSLFESSPTATVMAFTKSCKDLIAQCDDNHFPKLAVELSLLFARIACAFTSVGGHTESTRQQATQLRQEATDLLQRAEELCELKFKGAETLRDAIEHISRLLGNEWYEAVTPEELAAIKIAMVTGRQGIATHSGHWYNCVNGHPVSILPSVRMIHQAIADKSRSTVCHWRMWHAHGACTVS
jgi:hypothetical protein